MGAGQSPDRGIRSEEGIGGSQTGRSLHQTPAQSREDPSVNGIVWLRVQASAIGTAPLLRPHGVEGQKDGHLSEVAPLPSFTLAEAQIHDINVLPHLHREDKIEKLFPKIEAAPETDNSRDWIPNEDATAGGP